MGWATWQEDADAQRRLTATESEISEFAQAALRKVVGVETLVVTSVSGGPTVWTVGFAISAYWMEQAELNTLEKNVQTSVTALQDPSSTMFAKFVQEAEAAGISAPVVSVQVVDQPRIIGLTSLRADTLS